MTKKTTTKNNPKKNINKKIITSILVIILLIIISIFVVFRLTDKSRYFKDIISEGYNISTNIFEKLNLSNYIKDDTTLKLALSNDNSTDKINLGFQNYQDKNFFNINLKYKDYDLNYFHQNDKYYLESTSLLDNIYELNTDDSINKIITNILKLSNDNNYNSDITHLFKELKDVLQKSINKKYITVKKTKTLINNSEEKVTRYSYPLNKESLSKFITNISKNKELKSLIIASLNNYYQATKIGEDNFNDALNEMIINGTFNIYVQNNKIKKISIYALNDAEIDLYLTDDYVLLNLKSEKNHNLFTFNYNRKTKELTVYIVKNAKKAGELLINLSGNLNIDYTIYNNDTKSSGSIVNTYTSDDKTSGIINFTFNDKKVNIEYSITKDNSINNYDVSKATSISDPTDTEKNKIATAYNDIKNSEFINSLIDIYKKLEGINFSA